MASIPWSVHPFVHLSVCLSQFWGFLTFPDKLLWGLTSNFVCELIMGLLMLDWLTFGDAPLNSLLSLAWNCGSSFCTNCWLDWHQAWHIYTSWDSSDLVNFSWHSAEFWSFPSLWFVEQFLCIHYIYKLPAGRIDIEYNGWNMGLPRPITVWSCSA